MSQPLSRSQKAAVTRAWNKQREQEQEQLLQQQVQASGARNSKRHAEERWAGVMPSKRQRVNTAASREPVTDRRQPSSNAQQADGARDDDSKASFSDSGSEHSQRQCDYHHVDDEGGQDESDNDDLHSVASVDIEATLASEAPDTRRSRQAQHLFDDDEDVEDVPPHDTSLDYDHDVSLPPISHHCRSSSVRSGSSHTSGYNMHPPTTDEEDFQRITNTEDEENPPKGRRLDLRELSAGTQTQQKGVRNKQPQQPRLVSRQTVQPPTQAGPLTTSKKTVCQQNFDNEAPMVQRSTTGQAQHQTQKVQAQKVQAKVKPNIEPEAKEWPVCAQLVPHPKGRSTMRLTDQSTEVQRVIQHAIKSTSIDLIYRHAFPDPTELSRTMRKVILTSTRSLVQMYPQLGFKHIKERIKYPDHDFTDAMAKPVAEHFSTTRGDAKEIADNRIVGYDLSGQKDICKARVRVLLQDDNYTYPGDWDPESSPASQRRQIDEGKPFASSPMIACMRALCKKFDARHASDLFVSSIANTPNELELPPGLVALAATAIFAVLRDWQSGELERLDFEGNIYNRTYNTTLSWFTRAKEHNAMNYHRLMHGLYRLVWEQQDDTTVMTNTMACAIQ
ncbi:hypothetical protein VNI00_016674 [Paramarasmius palmivorus]|uniref:DUF6532 domain-containing protein n=1 Tax=Paramarasmius palmivorus TaxID=297713 RepID=A0AAW0BCD9_9AGAR